MQKVFLFTLIILTTFHSKAQTTLIQWASNVINVSTNNYSDYYRGPMQVLGPPNKFPETGMSPYAWSIAISKEKQFITVGFRKPIKAKKIYVAENLNPGAVMMILAYDSTNKEHLIYENKEPQPKEKGRMWEVSIPQTKFSVHAIALILVSNKLSGRNQIDAIGISDGTLINTVPNIPNAIFKENLGKKINSKAREVAPIISPDGKTLFFTREGHSENIGKTKTQDVWVSKMINKNEWSEAENIKNPINTDDHNAVSTISANGKTVYLVNLYMPDGTLKPGLSKSGQVNSIWEFPKQVKILDYYNLSNYTEFSLSPNGNVLIIACQRKGSYGGKDLYVSLKLDSDEWSQPFNMGNTLNTADNESTPFIAADEQTLYFSTSGHVGYGDNDIFMSHRLDSTWTNWSEPVNIGNQINTNKWDGYFTVPASGEYAYLSSEDNSLGAEDIFKIKLFDSIKPKPVAIIKGNITNASDKSTITSDVVIKILNDNFYTERIPLEFDPDTGEYLIILPLGKRYEINISKSGFISTNDSIDLNNEKSFYEIKKNITLVPIK